jgi:heptosyltransferase-2
MKGRILVIRGGAIGDFILTLPVLAALRAQFPETHLEVLGYAHIAGLARAGGLADAVHSIESRALAGFFARNGSLAPELGDYFGRFNIILSYLYDPDLIFQENVARCSQAQFIAGPHRPVETEEVHATEVFLRPLARLAICEASPVPRLQVAPPTTQPRPALALHPGSGSESKNWPESRWLELLNLLLEQTDFHLLLIGGEAEGDRLGRFTRALPADRCSVARNLPLPELAALMAGCQAFLGHDSGISHLAAALGLPGVVLWGPTNEKIWRPHSEQVQILRHPEGLPAITPASVLEHLRSLCDQSARSTNSPPES